MKFVALIQARLNSKRLPKKVLRPILNQPMLFYTISRLQKCTIPFHIVVTTTQLSSDDPLIDFCKSMNITTFRGSENNVLERFYQASKLYPADAYIRITGDCPLIDFQLLKHMLEHFMKNPKLDYLSNTLKRSYPKGLDIEIMKSHALERAYHQATSDYDKEHVTPYIYNHPEKFLLGNILDSDNFSHVNLSVDTFDDFIFVQKLIETLLPKNSSFTLKEIKAFLSSQTVRQA